MTLLNKITFAALVALWSLAANAAPANFYKAEVIVSSQSGSERARAARAGLEEVLVRASGDPSVAELPALAAPLRRAQTYVDQFAYGRGTDELGVTRETVVLSFAPAVIEKLLKSADAQVWPANRPQVLLWLVTDTPEQGRQLVNDPQDPLLASILKAAATRGLPIQLPLLDLDDRIGAAVEQVWAFDEEALLAASARYDAPVILAARAVTTGAGTLDLGWTLHHQDQWLSGQETLLAETDIGAAVVGPTANHLAAVYAVAPVGAEAASQQLAIDNIRDFAAYRAALNYLAGLAQVANHRLVAAGPDSLLLEVELLGSYDQLQNALKLDGKLELAPPLVEGPSFQVVEPAADGIIRLRWTG